MRKKTFPKAGILLWMVALFLAVLPSQANSGGLPEAVVRAHTIYIENETGFTELEYLTVLELNKWGRFEVVGTLEKADLILRLDGGSRVRAVPEGESAPIASSAPP